MRDADAAPPLVRDLAALGLEVEETHISWVFLSTDRAYKVKRPVNFGFLDFTTVEKRLQACEKEVELNRRLSPQVYLGILPVTMDQNGRHRLGGSGQAIDWAVVMVRLPASRRGDRLLEEGSLTSLHLDRLAGRLVAFHAAGPCDARTSRHGREEAVRRNVEENLRQSCAVLEAVLGPDHAVLESRLEDSIRGHAMRFEERIAKGRIRDGHGDLRLGQMYFDETGEAAVLDCIEFNDRFRYGDVASDIAFLAMDLAYHGREDLAENFLAAYARESGDHDLYGLVDFYQSYRACVRGKVAGYGAVDPGASDMERSAAAGEAGAYFRLALAKLGEPDRTVPIIAFGGGIGTGKSTLASGLGMRLAAPVLDSDRLRKQLAGIDPWAPREEATRLGLYAPGKTESLHAEIARRAQLILVSGRPVIIAATFRARAHRDALRGLASDLGRPYHFFECRASADLVRERLRQRAMGPSISDAREDMAEAFRASWEPDPAPGPSDTMVLDTGRPPEECLGDVLRRVSWRRAQPG